MLSPVVVVSGGLRRGRGRAKGVLEEAVLCGASAGDNSIDVISQSPVGPRAGAVFSRGPRCPSSLSKALLFQRGCSLGCELLCCRFKRGATFASKRCLLLGVGLKQRNNLWQGFDVFIVCRHFEEVE